MNTQSYNLAKKIARASLVLGLLGGIAALLPLSAQAQGGAPQGMGAAMGPMPKFVERGPKVGDQLPDLTIVDDLGNPVRIRDITGDGENYSVLTLGCLT